MPGPSVLVVDEEVAEALSTGRPVVALESTIISHGLPTATSAGTARRIEEAVRRGGAGPATLAVVDGAVRVGLSDGQLVRVAEDAGVVKTSVRDLGPVLARGLTGATTVAATTTLAHRAGIEVFATGGLGGVHRDARQSWTSPRTWSAWRACRSRWCAPACSRSSTWGRPSSGWRACRCPSWATGR
jgi:pseudouridine-5'-phosphate glycosidase